MGRLDGNVALITGAGSGIGRAAAERFAQEGAQVAVADYAVDTASATAAELVDAGYEAIYVEVDVSDAGQVDQMVRDTLDEFGRIDILLNCAGVLAFGTVLDTNEETWNRVLSVNLTGTFLCCKAVLPHMIEAGGGTIINVSSSTGAHDAGGNSAAYVASKGGVALLTRAMAIDHAKEGIRVNALAPGPTDTPMLRDNMSSEELADFAATFPMGRLGRPEELARAAVFLASDDSSFVTGAILAVDGGQTAEV